MHIKRHQLLGLGQAVGDSVTRHQAACMFGVAFDDLVLATLVIFKYTLHHPGLEVFEINRLEVFPGEPG